MAAATVHRQWEKARHAVAANADTIAAMTTHADIYRWAKSEHLDTRQLWPKVKAELRKQLGLDYDELRRSTRRTMADELAAAASNARTIHLCCAGDEEVGTFAVTDHAGDDAWYGDFFDRDGVADQTSADIAAANKAIYLAGKAREYAGLDVVGLRLTLSNHHVDLDALLGSAIKHRVHVVIDLTDGHNPALDQCREPGYRSWQEIALSDLFSANEQEDPAT